VHLFDEALALHHKAKTRVALHGHDQPRLLEHGRPLSAASRRRLRCRRCCSIPTCSATPIALTVNFAAALEAGAFDVRPRRAHQPLDPALDGADHAGQLQGAPTMTSTATVVTAARRDTWGPERRCRGVPPTPEDETVACGAIGVVAGSLRHAPRQRRAFPRSGTVDGDHSLTRLWVRDAQARPLDFPSLTALSDVFFPRVWLRRAKLTPAARSRSPPTSTPTRRSWPRSAAATCWPVRRGQQFGNGFFDQRRNCGARRACCSPPPTRSSTTRNEAMADSAPRRPPPSSAPATPPAAPSRAASPARATPACTRRSLDKLQPLVEQIEAEGGQAHGFASDARKEEEVVALFEQIERDIGPVEVLVFNIGANVPELILRPPRASTSRSGRWPASAASSRRARRPSVMAPRVARARSSSRAPPPAARRRELRRLLRRQARVARAGPEHGARAGAQGHCTWRMS
jgi:hypothetical protein